MLGLSLWASYALFCHWRKYWNPWQWGLDLGVLLKLRKWKQGWTSLKQSITPQILPFPAGNVGQLWGWLCWREKGFCLDMLHLSLFGWVTQCILCFIFLGCQMKTEIQHLGVVRNEHYIAHGMWRDSSTLFHWKVFRERPEPLFASWCPRNLLFPEKFSDCGTAW